MKSTNPKEIKEPKKGETTPSFIPWSDKEKASLTESIKKLELERLEKIQALETYEDGLKSADVEMEGAIAEAQREVKMAELKLNKMQFDKANDLTKKTYFEKIQEHKKEIARFEQNIKALTVQIERGKPAPIKQPDGSTEVPLENAQ